VNLTKNSINSTLLVKIRQAIQQDLDTRSPIAFRVKLIYADDRKIYRITLKQSQRFYILKLRGDNATKQSDRDINDLAKEYELLNNAWNYAQDFPANLTMSRPVALWPEDKAILLSGCAGKNLNAWFNRGIFRWLFSTKPLEMTLSQCGLWLGNFHQRSCQIADSGSYLVHRAQHLDRMLAFLDALPHPPLTPQQTKAIKSTFDQLSAQQTEEMVGMVHGNFAYRNILQTPEQIGLVDFEDARADLSAYDLGQFIAEILFKSQIPWLRPSTKKLVDAFKVTYQKSCLFHESTVQAYTGYHLVVNLYEHCARGNSGRLATQIIKFRVRYLLKLLNNWLSKSDSHRHKVGS